MNRLAVFKLINQERARQHERWQQAHPWGAGDCSSSEVEPIVKAAVLTEEVGEVAQAVLDVDSAALKTELIQVAAVAVAWLESFHESPSD